MLSIAAELRSFNQPPATKFNLSFDFNSYNCILNYKDGVDSGSAPHAGDYALCLWMSV